MTPATIQENKVNAMRMGAEGIQEVEGVVEGGVQEGEILLRVLGSDYYVWIITSIWITLLGD